MAEEQRRNTEAVFEGVEAQWAQFALQSLLGRSPQTQEFERPTIWLLEENHGWVALVPNPKTNLLDVLVVEIRDQALLPDGSTMLTNVRILSRLGIVQFIESHVEDAMKATEGRGVLEAMRDRKFPPGWISGFDQLSANVK